MTCKSVTIKRGDGGRILGAGEGGGDASGGTDECRCVAGCHRETHIWILSNSCLRKPELGL